ncbi:MAG TPA: VOC family protein [Burkholderiaceae bacterium]|nr:VOC family protein [Burkholderiaceae bacterium]
MPGLKCDHLVVIAPDLAEGVAYVRTHLGVDLPYGGRHPEMGTHNHVLRIGEDVFLEVIAVDEDAGRPARARWFGLDDGAAVRRAWDQGLRLRSWVARGTDLNAVLADAPELFDDVVRVSRGDRSWRFCLPRDGSLPARGAAPCVIDWGERGTPVPGMSDSGVALREFILEHPDPDAVRALYRRMGLANPPEVRLGATLRYRACLHTPAGMVQLA